MLNYSQIYHNRFDGQVIRRQELWKQLCRTYFQSFIGKSDTVMDIGAGYGEFINHIACDKKIAVDTNYDARKYLHEGVVFLNCPAMEIPSRYTASSNLVFMSNFLEHLNSKAEVLSVLKTAFRILKAGGRIVILQPNIDLAREKYWNWIDHNIALNGPCIIEALEISGFKLDQFIKRFLPLTTESRLPQTPILIPIYFSLPPFLRPFAGQSLFIASKP